VFNICLNFGIVEFATDETLGIEDPMKMSIATIGAIE